MRTLKRLGIGCSIFVAIIAALIYLAWRPAVDTTTLPTEGIRHFADIPIPQAPPDFNTLRFITYNIGYAYGDKNNTGEMLSASQITTHLNQMIGALAALHPDCIGLQEVDFDAARTHHIDQLAYLAHGLQMPFAAYVVTWNHRYVPWPYWPPSHHFGQIVSGQAVLSRYPITAQTTTLFAKPATNPWWYNLFYLDRIAQRLTLQLGAQTAVVWNVHAEAFDEPTRHLQLQQLAAAVRAETGRIWVLGDFNNASHHAFTTEFGNAAGLHNAELPAMTYSFASFAPDNKIDHIFYREPIALRTADTVRSLMASDHIPVWAEFALH